MPSAQNHIEWTQLLIRANDFAPDATNRIIFIINALLSQLRASAGFLSLSEIDAGKRQFRILRAVDVGMWAPAEKASRDAYAKNVDAIPDPFVTEYMARMNTAGGESMRRQDCVTDLDWYESDHYKIFRVRANQDACMYATMPAVDAFAQPFGENYFWTACACRATGEEQFSEQERDWFGQCFFGLGPLLKDVYHAPDQEIDADFAQLPLRLKRVVGCIMNGDSEKEVATKLGLSPHTVHGYIKELYTAMQVRSRAELLVKILK